VREPKVIAEQMAAPCAESKRTGTKFSLGAFDALQWLTNGGPGPLTGEATPKRLFASKLGLADSGADTPTLYG
jgi:hypothetical protein